jgi:hypothetical protein
MNNTQRESHSTWKKSRLKQNIELCHRQAQFPLDIVQILADIWTNEIPSKTKDECMNNRKPILLQLLGILLVSERTVVAVEFAGNKLCLISSD